MTGIVSWTLLSETVPCGIMLTSLCSVEGKSEELKVDIPSFNDSQATNFLPKSSPVQKQETNRPEDQKHGGISEQDIVQCFYSSTGETLPE